jgi:5,10-methylenetetrahydromethanopterin reductase
MLRLAGEIADVAHLASFFINLTRYRDDLELVRAGASQAGRSLGDFEIDISMPACVSSDRERARRAAKRPAAHAILWMAAAERYSRDRPDWRPPKEFDVPHEVVDALATRWDPWTTPDLPDELADLILDPILDQFALAGTPDECAERLKAILEQRPEATGVRIRAIQPAGMPAYEGYAETVRGMGHVIDAVRRALPAAARQ